MLLDIDMQKVVVAELTTVKRMDQNKEIYKYIDNDIDVCSYI